MFEALLEHIARGLDSRGIPYMLIGGQAVLLYGEPRLTRDVDVTLGAGPEKLPVILDWVRESGWQVLAESPADFVARNPGSSLPRARHRFALCALRRPSAGSGQAATCAFALI